MKKNMMMAVALLGAGITVHAQTSVKDSMRVVNLQEVQVVSTRATAKTPVAFTNIGKAELKKECYQCKDVLTCLNLQCKKKFLTDGTVSNCHMSVIRNGYII